MKKLLLFLLLTTSIVAAPPTKEQVDNAIKRTKEYLADNLINPDSYKEDEWTFWLGSESGKMYSRVQHRLFAMNTSGVVIRGTCIGTQTSNGDWEFIGADITLFGTPSDEEIERKLSLFKPLIEEKKTVPKEDVVTIKAKRTLGGKELPES